MSVEYRRRGRRHNDQGSVTPTGPPVKPSNLQVSRPNPSHQVLFGTARPPDVPTAIVRRLRAAIALGLWADGDRLPREADLVEQLGVTAFALREALGMLRDDGLITTRAGRYGGSFVSRGTDRALLASGELRRMSAIELRELGDWRQMLASGSASLAAKRASASSANRLREYADALRSAETVVEARRAHGRFHLELAAAAQSIRMTRAEFAMYEEFDWLLGLIFMDPQLRQESSQELMDIAAAVADRMPEAARVAAEKHSTSIIDALVKVRLAAIVADLHEDRANDAASHTLADEVLDILSAVTQSLENVAARVQVVMEERVDTGEMRTRLSRTAMSELLAGRLALDGIGFLAEPATLPGSEYWVAWWRRTAEEVSVDDSHVMDPNRDDFYDYPSLDFFTVPRRSGGLWAQGPYVDYGGADDYIITFAAPVSSDGRFIGVTAADLRVATIERQLAPWLTASGGQCVLINGERRVIVSNSAAYIVGDVLAPIAASTVIEIPHLGWCVVSA